MNQHFKKRKSRTSSAPAATPRRLKAAPMAPTELKDAALASVTTSTAAAAATGSSSSSNNNSHCAIPGPPPSATTASESAGLASALTALKVSLRREMESFLPPTPAASPVHSRATKRARFDFGVVIPDLAEDRVPDCRPKASPLPNKARCTAFLSVSSKLKLELDRRQRKTTPELLHRTAKKRRQQLSYFAIASAFHRAAHERERAIVPTPSSP